MYSQLKTVLLTLGILLITYNIFATTRKVLFIGNSYTYTNNMPLMLQNLAASLGDTLVYQESDPGGYTFQLHSTYAPTITKIFSQQWDVVVLQEQSQLPAFPPSQVSVEVYPYARILDSMVHANDTCTQTMFLMTWGHANGDPSNCASYPVICTYNGMQQRLRESYVQMTQNNHAVLAPVGAAWKTVRDSFPTLWLYQADSVHPSVSGSYVEACVLYNSIFHKKTYNAAFINGLTTSDAHNIQHIADKITHDSLTQWQQYGHYPNAGFLYSSTGRKTTFTGQSNNATKYTWHFGDGNTDTAANPVHTYGANGKYTVSHTATTKCFSETIIDTVIVSNAGVAELYQNESPVGVAQNGNGNISFIFLKSMRCEVMEIYDAGGKTVKRYSVSGTIIKDNLAPGFYILHAYSVDRTVSYYNKFVVH